MNLLEQHKPVGSYVIDQALAIALNYLNCSGVRIDEAARLYLLKVIFREADCHVDHPVRLANTAIVEFERTH
jgi:hypothetical protein